MNRPLLMSTLVAALSLAACDHPTVVAVPTPTVGVPGPAGPQGAPGYDGQKGETGKPGSGDTVIVVPPN